MVADRIHISENADQPAKPAQPTGDSPDAATRHLPADQATDKVLSAQPVRRQLDADEIRDLLRQVTDPEIPVLTIADLGILRDVQVGDEGIEIVLTPTYSGCPAMDVIRMRVRMVLAEAGLNNVRVTTTLSPAWTTDWITAEGRQKLEAYGIAPPNPVQQFCTTGYFRQPEAVRCPRCQSWHTSLISEFGSTPCKALYRCEDCKEPFDHFKCH